MPHARLIEQRLRLLKFSEQDNSRALGEVKNLVGASIDEMLDSFYDHVLSQPELKALFRDRESLKNARDQQKSHWMRILFARRFGEEEFRDMKQVGEAHVKVGLRSSWYLSAYCFMLNELIARIVERYRGDTRGLKRVLHALNKVAVLDISFVLDSYFDAKNATMKDVLLRATRFTEDVTQLTGDLNRTAEELQASGRSLVDAPVDPIEARRLLESSSRLAKQLADLNERLERLMYGDRLKVVDERRDSFLTRAKAFLDGI